MAGGKHACPILLAYLLAVYVVAASPVGRDAHIEPSEGSDAPTASGMAGPNLLGGTKHGNPAGAALCRAPRTRPFRSSGIKGVRPGIVGPIATARAVRCLRTTSLYVLIWPWFMWLPLRRELIQLVAQKCLESPAHVARRYLIFFGVQSPAWLDSKLFPVIFFFCVVNASIRIRMHKMLRWLWEDKHATFGAVFVRALGLHCDEHALAGWYELGGS